MPDDLHSCGTVYISRFIQGLINAHYRCYIQNSRPTQCLPCGPEPHRNPDMVRVLKKEYRRLDKPQLAQKAVDDTFTGEHGKCQGIYEDPTDKVWKSGYGLDKFAETHSFDLGQEDGKNHGKPREQYTQPAHAERIFDDLKQLIDLNLVLYQGTKPFETDKRRL
ncbi:hypothetical protein D3C73_1166900 [compost metagenome]